MAINANFLSFVGGGARQITKNKDEFKKELRENKRRQRDWMNTYGNKVISENKQQEESVTAALKQLESRGLQQPDVLQLMQRHGVEAVLQLQKYVNEYESKNDTTIDADLMNKVWKAADDFTNTSGSYGEAVSKVFGTNKAGATAPIIQEAEDRSFFDKLKANLSGDFEDEQYADFLDDPTEGIGDQSINDLRRMAAASPSMLGTDGAAVFDRSQLRGDEPTAGEVRLWKNTTNIIVREALKNLSPADRQAVAKRENSDMALIDRDTDDIFFDLADPDSVYFEAFSEATRKVHEQNPFSDNRSARGAYGGQAALDAILNPKTIEELFEDTGRDPSELQVFATDEEALEFFKRNEEEFVYVGTDNDKELIARPSNLPVTPDTAAADTDTAAADAEPPVVITETDFDPDTYELLVQPEPDPVVEAKPEREVYASGREKRSSKQARTDWIREYGKKYFNDGSKRYVSPRPTEEGEPQRLWDSLWGSTHDFETGFPLIAGETE